MENKSITFNPNAHRWSIYLDYLFKNCNGVHINTAAKDLNVTESGMRTIIKRIRELKRKTITITILEKIITTKINGHFPTKEDIENNIKEGNERKCLSGIKNNVPQLEQRQQAQTNSKLIIDILKQHPEGISIEYLIDNLNTTKQSIYNYMNKLRSRKYNIVNMKGLYYLIDEKHTTEVTKKKYNYSYNKNGIVEHENPDKSIKKNNLIPIEYKTSFENLPDNDKIECINLMKKSMYYYKSALSLMDTNQMAFNLLSNMQGLLK